MADVSLRWHSAHLPVASTNSAFGCCRSVIGRFALIIKAATMSAVPRNIAVNTVAKLPRGFVSFIGAIVQIAAATGSPLILLGFRSRTA
jgi:hypothetical protein